MARNTGIDGRRVSPHRVGLFARSWRHDGFVGEIPKGEDVLVVTHREKTPSRLICWWASPESDFVLGLVFGFLLGVMAVVVVL